MYFRSVGITPRTHGQRRLANPSQSCEGFFFVASPVSAFDLTVEGEIYVIPPLWLIFLLVPLEMFTFYRLHFKRCIALSNEIFS